MSREEIISTTRKEDVRKAIMFLHYYVLHHFPSYVLPSVLNNRNLFLSFFTGLTKPVSRLPHLGSKSLFGFPAIDRLLIDRCREASLNGALTLYLGGILTLYVGSNDLRKTVVDESQVGVVNQDALNIMSGLTAGNRVMGASLVYTPWKINGEINNVYMDERKHLFGNFTDQSSALLQPVLIAIKGFLEEVKDSAQFSLHVFARNIMLRVISTWMQLRPVDILCDENPEFFDVIEKAAEYSIGRIPYNAHYEEAALALGMRLLEDNFSAFKDDEKHFFNVMFKKRELVIPETVDEFRSFSPSEQKKLTSVIMNIISTVFGGGDAAPLVFEHALARLLASPEMYETFKRGARSIHEGQLSEIDLFDKSGALSFMSNYILETTFLCPPFAAQLFALSKQLTVVVNDVTVKIPAGSLLLVDYQACNAEVRQRLEQSVGGFEEMLKPQKTIENFRLEANSASCGGSTEKPFSRRCPVMVSAVKAMTLGLWQVLKEFDVVVNSPVSTDCDQSAFPVNKRYDARETIVLTRVRTAQAANQCAMFSGTDVPASVMSSEPGVSLGCPFKARNAGGGIAT